MSLSHLFMVLLDFESLEKEIQTIGEKLVPNWFALLVQVAALVVLILVVFFIAYKPVKKLLKQRSDFMEQEILDAQKNKALAEANAVQSQETLLASKKQASEIIENANKVALENKNNILLETETQVNKMKEDAQKDIEKSREEALEAIHDEMVNVAIDASKVILQREVNEKDDKKLAEEFIKELE